MFNMRKRHKDGYEYLLSVPYEKDEDLEEIIYEEILGEAHRIAELRNGFIEGTVTALDGTERHWG